MHIQPWPAPWIDLPEGLPFLQLDIADGVFQLGDGPAQQRRQAVPEEPFAVEP